MRALVYHGPGHQAWQEAPDPEITDGTGPIGLSAITTAQLSSPSHIVAIDLAGLVL
jgi:hypothetical protein